MRFRIKRNEISTLLIAVAALLVYNVNLSIIGIDGSKIRYYACTFALLHGLAKIVLKKQADTNGSQKYKTVGTGLFGIVLVAGVFLLVSIYKAYSIQHAFSTKTLRELYYMVFPAMYAYCLLNILSFETIMRFFKMMLWIVVFFCFFNAGFDAVSNLDNWIGVLKILDSSSTQLENISFNGLVLALFCFFAYFRHTGSTAVQKQTTNLCYWVSLFMVFVVHKRPESVFVIALLFLGCFVDFYGKLPKWLVYAAPFGLALLTLIYFKVLSGDFLQNFDIYFFSSGRSSFLAMWKAYGYMTYGLGSSVMLLGKNLEMDFVKIYLELGAIPLLLFIFSCIRLTKENVFAYLFMMYQFLNMLFSSSLWLWYDWVVVYVTIELIYLKDRDMDLVYRRKGKFKKLFSRVCWQEQG